MAYTKLFSHIVTSSIWTEDDQTRIVWITLLALSDRRGEVMASVPGLARVAGVPVSAVEAAINKFLSPDEYSRTPDEQGRRIEKIDGGWALLNHAKHRRMASVEEQKERNAERQRRFRERAERNAPVTESNAPVTVSNGSVTPRNAPVTHRPYNAEAEAEAEAEVLPSEAEGSPDPSQAKGSAATPQTKPKRSVAQLPDEVFLAELARHYPEINLEAELRKMDAWILTHPGKTKTRRFIVNWLNRIDVPLGKTETKHSKYADAW